MYCEEDSTSDLRCTNFQGKDLVGLIRCGTSPCDGTWDAHLLVHDVEENLGTEVVDIPRVYSGRKNYGFHLTLGNGHEVIARLALTDINAPYYEGDSAETLQFDLQFELDLDEIAKHVPGLLASRLIYHRAPVTSEEDPLDNPRDIDGRCLVVTEKRVGSCNIWSGLNAEQKRQFLDHAAAIRASMFHLKLPESFARTWYYNLQPPHPRGTHGREVTLALVAAKVEKVIGKVGDQIYENYTTGTSAVVVKQRLLRLLPYLLPQDKSLYRPVLEHTYFGSHNMTATVDELGCTTITSTFNWKNGYVMPAILSDPRMGVSVDLVLDEDGEPAATRVALLASDNKKAMYSVWSAHYFKALFSEAPNYERVLAQGRDIRYVWFAMNRWRGNNPEEFFTKLAEWVRNKSQEHT